MAKYVDGFVLVVPKKNLKAYRQLAKEGCRVWMKYGALQYMECMGDDLAPGMLNGAQSLFLKMTKAKSNETVWFSFIVFKSRKHRDQVNAKVMKDPYMNDPEMQKKAMPFDMKRMAYGGFQAVVEA